MEEYSRILIEEYCMNHDTAKSRRLKKLVDMSYDYIMGGTDSDAYFLEKLILNEKDPVFKKALEDLDECLFGMW